MLILAIPERLRHEQLIIKRYTKMMFTLLLLYIMLRPRIAYAAAAACLPPTATNHVTSKTY